MLTEGSHLSDCELGIESVPAVVRCRGCASTTTLDLPVLACATCESLDVELVSGEEFHIASFDVATDAV